jgi:hypothetical protein
MQRLMTCSLVTILSLAVAGAARADGSRGHSTSHPSGTGRGSSMSRSGDSRHYDTRRGDFKDYYKDYHLTHGVSFKYGYFFKGKEHYHWSYSCWSERYGCNIYWCPCTCCYYYWCQPYDCYYPVSYCPTGKYAY